MKTKPNKPKIMLDLETYGTSPGCKIMSISAIQFMQDSRDEAHFFHTLVEREFQSFLREEKDTMDWWSEQDQRVFKDMSEGGARMRLGEALQDFGDWLAKTFPDGYELWCNGATFDVPVMEAAYKALGLPIPWEFRVTRCYRTLVKEFGYMVEEPEFIGDKHNSFHDAVHQASYATLILRRLHGDR